MHARGIAPQLRRGLSRSEGGAFAGDLARYYENTVHADSPTLGKLRLWTVNREFHVVAGFRFEKAARRLAGRNRVAGALPLLVAFAWRRWNTTIHHANITVSADIGPGLFILHRTGLYIGPVTIGKNCVLNHNVTLGVKWAGGGRGVPSLGDNVWIGPGATVSGDVTVGDNVTIAAGTVLTKSVPDGCLVAGNPGRIVQHDYDNSPMIHRFGHVRRADPAGTPNGSWNAGSLSEPRTGEEPA